MNTARRLPELGLEPLTARSVALTTLLGTHPPRLPVRALVAVGALFGIAEGTMRTALSRMVTAGELEVDGRSYVLGERLRRRQATQDAARQPASEPWDGTWWLAMVEAGGRSMAERRAFRTRMREAWMGELRPDLWLRPANVERPVATEGVLLVRGTIEERDPAALAAQLWDLPHLAGTARTLTELVEDARGWLEDRNPEVLGDTFLVSVAAVRYLREEPRLPRAVVGADWPANGLRSAYDRLEAAHGEVMAVFLARASEVA